MAEVLDRVAETKPLSPALSKVRRMDGALIHPGLILVNYDWYCLQFTKKQKQKNTIYNCYMLDVFQPEG